MTIEMLGTATDELMKNMDTLEREVDKLMESHRYLVAVLEEVDDYLDDRADVDNGMPNTAMRLLTAVRAALGKEKR